MKKALYLCLLLFLISCAPILKPTPAPIIVPTPIPAASIQNLRQEYPPTIEAFDVSEKCPHICWLGINPGITSIEDAHVVLRASDQINQKTFHASEDGIGTIWFTEKTKTFSSGVGVGSVAGKVESISFSELTPFTLNDFVNLFGEPDEISIRMEKAPEAEFVSYMLYYNGKKTRIRVLTGSNTGPEPTDRVEMLVLGTSFTKLSLPWLVSYDDYHQPWLGYGHFKDYLPGESTPVSDHPTP